MIVTKIDKKVLISELSLYLKNYMNYLNVIVYKHFKFSNNKYFLYYWQYNLYNNKKAAKNYSLAFLFIQIFFSLFNF